MEMMVLSALLVLLVLPVRQVQSARRDPFPMMLWRP
jgi:hypothetical protein